MIARLLLLLLLAICAAWAAQHQGNATLIWGQWRVDTSVSLLLVLMAVGGVIVAGLWRMVILLFTSPGALLGAYRTRQYKRGIQAVTETIAALSIQDVSRATAQGKIAQAALGGMPINFLLQAQIARLKGDESRMRTLLEQMQQHRETKFLATSFLAEQDQRLGHFTQAMAHATEAAQLQPKNTAAARRLFTLYLRNAEFAPAQQLALRARRKGALSRAESRRLLAIGWAEEARRLLQNDALHSANETIIRLARQAQRLAPTEPAFIALLATAHAKNDDVESAFQLLRNRWKKEPHAALAAVFFDIYATTTTAALTKAAEKLTASQPDHTQSHVLLARAYARAKSWPMARKHAKTALARAETESMCRLMAEIEHAEFGDFDAAHQWTLRAASAASDGAYHCSQCHQQTASWAALCPSCSALDSLEYRTPYDHHTPENEFEIPAFVPFA